MKRLIGIFVGICIAIHYAYSVISGNPFGQVWSVIGAMAVGLAYSIDFALSRGPKTIVVRHEYPNGDAVEYQPELKIHDGE